MATIHDKPLARYEIDCGERRIVFHFGAGEADETTSTTAIFDGVAAYELKDDAFGTFGGEIVDVPTEDFVERYGVTIVNAFNRAGAFGPWACSSQSIKQHIESENLQGFEITSSIGLHGWLLGKHLSITAE